MITHIKGFLTRFNNKIYTTLWIESLLFSALFGVAFHSWLVFSLMSVGLFWLIHQTKGMAYTVIALSLFFGFISASIGYSFGGWLWAGILGIMVLVKAIQVHWRKLGMSWVDLGFRWNKVVRWQRNGYLGRQNLN